ncbi:MAG: ECF transporter S component [Butyrivibrio sp.]
MKNVTRKLTLSAMFMAIGILLPLLTGQIQRIGNMLLPMHIPVLLCGLICGWQYGAVVGFILPLMRSVMFGMPPFYPMAVAMAFELAAYGFVTGFVYSRVHRKNIGTTYLSLIIGMISGRVIWGIAEVILLGIGGKSFTWKMFISGAVLNAVPGIVIQLIIIPAIMAAVRKLTVDT